MNESDELIQLDKELLSDYVQRLGRGVVKQMFDLYIQQVALYINDIESSLLCDNSQLWQEHCHKMKGAAGSVGLKSLHLRLKEMEKTTINMSGKAHQLAELKTHNKQAIAAFDDWLAGL
jgi:HPt (histidine-containing phosphotransfer) domain-containing protein